MFMCAKDIVGNADKSNFLQLQTGFFAHLATCRLDGLFAPVDPATR